MNHQSRSVLCKDRRAKAALSHVLWRLFLAYLSEQERDAYFKSVKLKLTSSSTLIVRSKIEQVLEKICSTGISTTMGNIRRRGRLLRSYSQLGQQRRSRLTVEFRYTAENASWNSFTHRHPWSEGDFSLLGYREEIAVEPAARVSNRVDGGARRQIADAKA